jgi:tetratricopeptide (TPR) repeat protein
VELKSKRLKTWASLLLGLVVSWLGVAPSLEGQDASAELSRHRQNVQQALRANDRETAEREYRAILALDSGNSEAWTGLGILLYGEGKAADSQTALRKALGIVPYAKHAELFLGLTEADLRHCSQATPILSKYFQSEPAGNLQRLTGLALLNCASSAADSSNAVQTAAKLKQLYPGDPDVLYESAELYTRLWNDSAGELLAKHPDSYRVHQLAAEVYEAQNNYEQAIREYSLALQANPKLPQMHFRIGQLYLRQGFADADEKAMEQFRLEKSIDPESAVSDLAMAEIERRQHRLDEAKPLYEEAARLDPALVEAQVGLAQTLLAQHQTDSAIAELNAAVAKHPQDAQAHYVLMLAYREQGKITEASAEMTAFKQLQASNDRSFQNKLNALLNTKPNPGETVPK